MDGLQDQEATAIRIQISWPTIHLWKVSVPSVSSVYLHICFLTAKGLLIGVLLQHFYIKGSSVHSTYHGSYNWPPPQQSPGSMLTFSLTAVCRTSWVPVFIVSPAFRWTYVRIVNLPGCPVIWILRMGDMTLHIS